MHGTFENMTDAEFANAFEHQAHSGWDREMLARFRRLVDFEQFPIPTDEELPAFLRRQAD